MRFSQGFPITANGRIAVVDVASFTAPATFIGGLMYDAVGRLVTKIQAVAPDAVVNGWPISAEGALKISNTTVMTGGLPFRNGVAYGTGAAQAVQTSSANALAGSMNGWPITAEGLLAIEFANPAP